MSITVRDLTPDFLAFVAAAAAADGAGRRALWQRYVDKNQDVFDVYFARAVPIGDELDDLLNRLLQQVDHLQRRARAASDGAADALTAAVRLMGATQDAVDVQAVVMVGLFRANGWVDQLAGRDELFIAVEQLPDVDRHGRLLLVHEAAHVVHSRVRQGSAWSDYGVSEALLAEGLATQVSAEAVPDLSDAEYLWFDDDHQGWLDECSRQRSVIAARLAQDLEAYDLDTYAVYFMTRESARREELPRRCGYFIGLQVARQLRRAHTAAAISRWDRDRVKREVRAALLAEPQWGVPA